MEGGEAMEYLVIALLILVVIAHILDRKRK